MQLEYAKNPVWANAEHTMIDLTIKWDAIDEELPFSASPNDPEVHGRAIFAAAVEGKYGPIAEYTPPPLEQLAELARAKRDHLLAESDWTQLPDARAAMGVEKAAEWNVYRQSLRDVPSQSGFPTDILWPIKP